LYPCLQRGWEETLTLERAVEEKTVDI